MAFLNELEYRLSDQGKLAEEAANLLEADLYRQRREKEKAKAIFRRNGEMNSYLSNPNLAHLKKRVEELTGRVLKKLPEAPEESVTPDYYPRHMTYEEAMRARRLEWTASLSPAQVVDAVYHPISAYGDFAILLKRGWETARIFIEEFRGEKVLKIEGERNFFQENLDETVEQSVLDAALLEAVARPKIPDYPSQPEQDPSWFYGE